MRDTDRGRDDICERGVTVVLRGVGAERVGVHHVRSGGEVRLVHCADILRTGDVPQFGDFARLKSFGLKLRSHAAVQKQERCLVEDVFHVVGISSLTPMMALTDFEGTIRRVSVSDTPTLRGASRSESSSRWAVSGKSP